MGEKILNLDQYVQCRKMLITGFLASVVTVLLGELPIGWTVYPEADNEIVSMLLGCRELSLPQLALGVLFGAIGIGFQAYGFEGVSRIVSSGGSAKAGKLIHWGAVATGLLGGIVHILCVALMFVCKTADLQQGAVIPQSVWDFTLYLVMPVCVVFMPVYYAMCIAMLLAVGKGNTVFPRWAAALNPLTATVVLNALPLFAPNTPFVNALNMANMGIGSLLTFGGMLLLLKKQK